MRLMVTEKEKEPVNLCCRVAVALWLSCKGSEMFPYKKAHDHAFTILKHSREPIQVFIFYYKSSFFLWSNP